MGDAGGGDAKKAVVADKRRISHLPRQGASKINVGFGEGRVSVGRCKIRSVRQEPCSHRGFRNTEFYSRG